VVGVLTSVFGAFYYLRIVKIMYFDEVKEALDARVAPSLTAVLAIGSLFTLLFFVMPGPLVRAANAAAASLFP
jgi:NADH-quinone oxidoreductase subunit N